MLTNFLREEDATSLLKWPLMIQLIKKPSLWTRVESLQPVGTRANQAELPQETIYTLRRLQSHGTHPQTSCQGDLCHLDLLPASVEGIEKDCFWAHLDWSSDKDKRKTSYNPLYPNSPPPQPQQLAT